MQLLTIKRQLQNAEALTNVQLEREGHDKSKLEAETPVLSRRRLECWKICGHLGIAA